MKEHLLEESGISSFVSVGQGAFLWGLLGTKVSDLPLDGSKSIANLPEALGLTQMAKKHGNKLVPGLEPFEILVVTSFLDKPCKGFLRNCI
jgi:hypothetical protein